MACSTSPSNTQSTPAQPIGPNGLWQPRRARPPLDQKPSTSYDPFTQTSYSPYCKRTRRSYITNASNHTFLRATLWQKGQGPDRQLTGKPKLPFYEKHLEPKEFSRVWGSFVAGLVTFKPKEQWGKGKNWVRIDADEGDDLKKE